MHDADMPAQPVPYAQVLAANVRAARARADLKQVSLARRMRQLGCRWHFQTVGAVERGERPLSAYEVAALAFALDTRPDVLYLPPQNVVPQVAFGDQVIPAQRYEMVDDSVSWDGDEIKITPPSVQLGPFDRRLAALQARDEPQLAAKVADYGAHLRRQASDRPVVAAIVTSGQRVLVAQRIDGKPPWTFIAGEQELDEQPAETIIREVKEEASLEIRAGRIIGERDHPATGRHMIYIAAKPVRGTTEVEVGDKAELADVKWVSLAEADELLPGMFAPVREYLARVLARGGRRT